MEPSPAGLSVPKDAAPWTVLRGPVSAGAIAAAVQETAVRHGLLLTRPRPDALRLSRPPGSTPVLSVRWTALPPQPPAVLGYQMPALDTVEILVDHPGGMPGPAVRDVLRSLQSLCLPYAPRELDGIAASMPLVAQYAHPCEAFENWAVLFRDHRLEHSVGFLLGLERSGIPAEWMFALDKGDRTLNSDRIHATYLARGYHSDLLDNAAIDAAGPASGRLRRVTDRIDTFISDARNAGRKILIIDDGGLLARGYGTRQGIRADAAIELTVSGIKRIASAPELGIPVLNMARSQVKTLLGYREIADSCIRRLRAILPDRKFIGRHVLLIGYGTLGSRLAAALRALGCRVDIVDTDLPTLITAAEDGYTTHRSAGEALRASEPFLVIGTAGEIALTSADMAHLPDGVLLAPFATRDFSALTQGTHAVGTGIPGVGISFQFPDGRTATLLGNGRSMNLFEADSIPNQGYDAYRAGTLIAARHLCAHHERIPPGLHTEPADRAITDAGLYEAYYDRYNAPRPPASRTPAASREKTLSKACIIGYGVAGRLHTRLFADLGTELTIIDPKHQDLPKAHRSFHSEIGDLPDSVIADTEIWSVCCPTADHLPVLRAILQRNPSARVLMEKPACRGNEIDEFAALLDRHPQARIVVNDQYRHSHAIMLLSRLVGDFSPDDPVERIAITFNKDRSNDVAMGRFVDRDYGVLGYEWTHMLAALAVLLPADAMSGYLAADPRGSDLRASYDPRLFMPTLAETTAVTDQGRTIRVDLASSVIEPGTALITESSTRAPWRTAIRPADTRNRRILIQAGPTRFVLQLEPVTTADGRQLDRDHHHVAVHRDGAVLHEEVIHDAVMSKSVQHATAALLAADAPPAPDLSSLRRIAVLADFLRQKQPLSSNDTQAAGS